MSETKTILFLTWHERPLGWRADHPWMERSEYTIEGGGGGRRWTAGLNTPIGGRSGIFLPGHVRSFEQAAVHVAADLLRDSAGADDRGRVWLKQIAEAIEEASRCQ